jgi:ABC-type spermidine/putrescine transport system permease subunit I
VALAPDVVERRAARGAWRPDLPGFAATILSTPLFVIFALLVAYPLVQIVIEAFPSHGWAAFSALFHEHAFVQSLGTTFLDSAISMAIALLIGAVLAWSLRAPRSRIGRAILWVSVLLPMSMSVVVANYSWITILGRFGVLNAILGAFGLAPHDLLFTPIAVTCGMVYTLVPYAFFPLYVTFRSIPDDILHASAGLGSSRLQTVRSVVIPLSLPGLFITGVLLYVLSLGFYVTPIVLGGPRATFLAALVQQDIQTSYNTTGAAATSVLMMAAALILVIVGLTAVGNERFERALG